MASLQQNMVCYCCVLKGNRVLHAETRGDPEIEKLAATWLDKAPPFHRWYFQTGSNKTVGFLMEDGYVYFTIMAEAVGSQRALQFLKRLRDGFRKVPWRRHSSQSLSIMEEQLVPIIRRLISSLEHVSQDDCDNWGDQTQTPSAAPGTGDHGNGGGVESMVASTKAPLLGTKKMKEGDPMLAVQDVDLEEHWESNDRDMGARELADQGRGASSNSLQKSLSLGSGRMRSGSQNMLHKRWWRLVWIVLVIDAAVCLILFLVWLGVCYSWGCFR